MFCGNTAYPVYGQRPQRPCCRPPAPPCWDEPERHPCGCGDSALRMRLFDFDRRPPSGCACCDRPLPPAAPPVTIVNPWNCRERAVVTLSVDECGNLVVYVKR